MKGSRCQEGPDYPKQKIIQSKRRVRQTEEDFEFHSISRKTTLQLSKTLTVEQLQIYGCDTHKSNTGDDRAVAVFHNKCLRKIVQMKWEHDNGTKEL